MHFIKDDRYQALAERLVEAAAHPSDPESEIKIALAEYDVMPASSRPDFEQVTVTVKAAPPAPRITDLPRSPSVAEMNALHNRMWDKAFAETRLFGGK